MKFPFLVLAIVFFMSGCGSAEKEEKAQPDQKPIHSILFIDKTESVSVSNPFILNKYKNIIQSLVDVNINKAGDQLEIYYIHENTSKARCLNLVARTTKEPEEGMNATDLEANKNNYELSIAKERKLIFNMAMEKLMAENNGASNRETNISVSVPLVSDALKGNEDVRVYYFSDMIESVKAGRDFHITPPSSTEVAQEWAKTDAAKYKNLNLSSAVITVILPFEATSSSKENNPHVTEYWKAYFGELGVNQISEL